LAGLEESWLSNSRLRTAQHNFPLRVHARNKCFRTTPGEKDPFYISFLVSHPIVTQTQPIAECDLINVFPELFETSIWSVSSVIRLQNMRTLIHLYPEKEETIPGTLISQERRYRGEYPMSNHSTLFTTRMSEFSSPISPSEIHTE
jgi:hypothetical protein